MGFSIVPLDGRVSELKTGVGSGVQNSAFTLESPRARDRGGQWGSE